MRLVVLALVAVPLVAHAGDPCARGAKHHGAPIDLDLKDADVHDVFRLLSDVGHVNLVVSDEVAGKVTLRLKHVAWDLAACTIAASQHLQLDVQDNILIVKKAR
jgi:type II secretory pathway component HofQ